MKWDTNVRPFPSIKNQSFNTEKNFFCLSLIMSLRYSTRMRHFGKKWNGMVRNWNKSKIFGLKKYLMSIVKVLNEIRDFLAISLNQESIFQHRKNFFCSSLIMLLWYETWPKHFGKTWNGMVRNWNQTKIFDP
jgi:hypothetical protein